MEPERERRLTRIRSCDSLYAPGTKAWVRNQSSETPPYVLVTLRDAPQCGDDRLAATGPDGAEVLVKRNELFLANDGEPQPDNSMLYHHSEAALLDNLVRRHMIQLPYCTTGNSKPHTHGMRQLPCWFAL